MNLRQIMVFGLLAAVAFGGIGYGVWMLSGMAGTIEDPGQVHPDEVPVEEVVEGDEPLATVDASDSVLQPLLEEGSSPDVLGDQDAEAERRAEEAWRRAHDRNMWGSAGNPNLRRQTPSQPGEGTGSGVEGDDQGTTRSRLRPHLRAGAPRVVGSLDHSQVSRVVRRRMRLIISCYTRELRTQPELAGEVTITFVIASDGGVQQSGVASSTLGSPPTERCILNTVRRWRFPEPPDGGTVQVSYPLEFSASSSEETGTGDTDSQD